MADITLEDGDDIERDNADWIRQNMPEYEELWSRFIGHDGKGSPPKDIGDLGKITSQNRERFYQAHYSLLATMLALEESKTKLQENCGEVRDSKAYLAVQKEITCFMAHVGRVRDMFKKMDSALGLKGDVWKRFDDYYNQRSAFLHGPIPSQEIEDGLLKVPGFGNSSTGELKWTDESRWSERGGFAFKFAAQFTEDVMNDLLKLNKGALSDCLDKIKELAGRPLPKMPAPPKPQLEQRALSAADWSEMSTSCPCFSATNEKPIPW